MPHSPLQIWSATAKRKIEKVFCEDPAVAKGYVSPPGYPLDRGPLRPAGQNRKETLEARALSWRVMDGFRWRVTVPNFVPTTKPYRVLPNARGWRPHLRKALLDGASVAHGNES
jgi:hypothetical protein